MPSIDRDLAELESGLWARSMRSRDHPRRPSWERGGFRNGARRLPGGQAWAMIAATDDEGPAADVAVATARATFEITAARRAGTRGTTAGETNYDRRNDVVVLSWLTDPDVASVVVDTERGPLPATLLGDIRPLAVGIGGAVHPVTEARAVRLYLAVVEDDAVTATQARHLDRAGDALAVEDLSWITDHAATSFEPTAAPGDTSMARTADEIAQVLAEQDHIDAGRHAVFRIEVAEPGCCLVDQNGEHDSDGAEDTNSSGMDRRR